MKKKTILASVMALALMASPLGILNVSAEEGTSVSGDSRAASSSEQVVLGTPYDLQLSESLDRLSFKWPVNNYGSFSAHVWVYRDDTLVLDYSSMGDNSSPGSLYVRQGSSGSYTLTIPLYQYDLTESGSYSFQVRMEAQWPDYLAVSETAVSEAVTYAHPGQTLGTTAGYWDAEKEGLFHFTSVEGAAGYEFRLYKQDESGNWNSCTLMSPKDGLLSTPGHRSVYSNIKPDTARDSGGEDRTRDFSNDIFGNHYNTPAGRYCVTVKALSNDPSEIAGGPEGEKSTVLEIGGNPDSGQPDDSDNSNASDDSSDSDQSDDTEEPAASTVEDLISNAKSGEVISTQGITSLSNAEMKMLLERKVTLEMSYTYEDVNYNIRIPAGAAMDNDIPIYGPLYLAKYYRVTGSSKTQAASGPSYTVQSGDTLGRIARANNMKLSELKAKNPQIKNIDLILPGQVIQIK